jgi:hypothetical protein
MPNDMIFAFGDARRGTLDCRPTPVCDPRPVCPACGGLECLCRPRFFAGQLLSEEDLNRLDHYIVAKNRLHNRRLFGTGVVCGLEVVCSPCDPAGGGNVIVRAGYALSPCGNDIVVCKEQNVDVCDLINRCRPRHDECFQPGAAPTECPEGDEDWILAICYQETPSRGITALRGAACTCGAGCGCGCGGGKTSMQGGTTYAAYGAEASCGCGGGTMSKTAKTKPAARPGPVPPQCEPTLVCEGFTFAVYQVPPKERQRDFGALIRRFLCCWQPLAEQLVQLPGANATKQELQDWLLSLIAAMREFLLTEGLYDCDLAAQLAQVARPTPDQEINPYLQQWQVSALSVLQIVVAVFQKCACAALLPPCPPAEMTDCVPIATLTVARAHCRVRRICNIANRRFLVTFPSIEYWLSWLPLFSTAWQQGRTFQDLIAEFCCTPVADRLNFKDPNAFVLRRAAAPNVAAPAAIVAGPEVGSIHPFTRLLAESLGGETPEANAATLLLAAMGARRADGSLFASDTAVAHPGEAMLIDQILAPAIAPVMPLFGGAGRGGHPETVKALGAEVERLGRVVAEQQRVIDEFLKG